MRRRSCSKASRSAPDAGTYWRIIARARRGGAVHRADAFRAIKKEDPRGEHVGRYDISRFRTLFLAGERADPDTVKWAEQKLKVPVIDHWWQTETGSPMSQNPAGLGFLPVKYGSPGVPMPGYDIRILDDDRNPVAAGTLGNVVVKLPLPPGCLPTLWHADQRFRDAYLDEFPATTRPRMPGCRRGRIPFVMSRTDDIINVAGHRLSTGPMEEVVAEHPDVAECAVVGIADAMKGQVPCGFIVLNAGVSRDADTIEREVVGLVRERIGPVAAFKTVVTVKRLPKTRSGKILRGTMKKLADGETMDNARNDRRSDDPRRDHAGPQRPRHRGLKSGRRRRLAAPENIFAKPPDPPDRLLSGGVCDSVCIDAREGD